MNTPCHLPGCEQASHVVLFASGRQLCGIPTRPRQMVTFCLRHGGELYDVMREWNGRVDTVAKLFNVPKELIDGQPSMKHSAVCPAWLVADLRNDRLPRRTPDPRGWTNPVARSSTWTHADFRKTPTVGTR